VMHDFSVRTQGGELEKARRGAMAENADNADEAEIAEVAYFL